jgi:glycosyltransferase involved in cell wall biosynthesis
MSKAKPLISVVTVTFNAAQTIRSTFASLRSQTWQDFEYVVIDGGSTDDTLAILDENSDLLDVRVSDKDQGIYDAMNKGVSRARGKYLFFLNADDCFADEHVLADVVAALTTAPDTDVLYGNAISWDEQHRARHRFGWVDKHNIGFGNLCHQATFARRSLFERIGGFNLDFRIVADLDWFVRAFRGGAKGRYLDRDICLFYAGGAHARSLEKLQNEKRRMQQQYHGPFGIALGVFRFRMMRKMRGLISPIIEPLA